MSEKNEKLNIDWIQGLLDFLKVPLPKEMNVRLFGIIVGKEIVGLRKAVL